MVTWQRKSPTGGAKARRPSSDETDLPSTLPGKIGLGALAVLAVILSPVWFPILVLVRWTRWVLVPAAAGLGGWGAWLLFTASQTYRQMLADPMPGEARVLLLIALIGQALGLLLLSLICAVLASLARVEEATQEPEDGPYLPDDEEDELEEESPDVLWQPDSKQFRRLKEPRL